MNCCDELQKNNIPDSETSCVTCGRPYLSYICNKCGDGICETGENANNCAKDCGATTCAIEGEPTFSFAPNCCSGLKAISKYNNAGEELTGGLICANCSNGVCGKGEDKYNCDQDCK